MLAPTESQRLPIALSAWLVVSGMNLAILDHRNEIVFDHGPCPRNRR
jgi:hypothetical protein